MKILAGKNPKKAPSPSIVLPVQNIVKHACMLCNVQTVYLMNGQCSDSVAVLAAAQVWIIKCVTAPAMECKQSNTVLAPPLVSGVIILTTLILGIYSSKNVVLF